MNFVSFDEGDSISDKDLLEGLRKESFDVLSWNIDGLDEDFIVERFDAACSVINKHAPSVVLLQEVVVKHVFGFSNNCPRYTLHRESGNNGYFCGILTREDVIVESFNSQPFSRSSMGRELLELNCKIDGRQFCFLTSHLESLKESASIRKEQLSFCFNHMLKKPANVVTIFAGDLNIRENELRAIGGVPQNFYDAWENSGADMSKKFTWDLGLNDNKKFAFGKPRARYDRMFFRRDNRIKLVDFKLVGMERINKESNLLAKVNCFPSDHFGMLTNFKLL